MTVTGYKKKKLAKKYYDLEFSLFQNGKKIKISENFQFNGHSVSAICYNKKEKIFYFIKQFRPNYYLSKNKIFPLKPPGPSKSESLIANMFLPFISSDFSIV